MWISNERPQYSYLKGEMCSVADSYTCAISKNCKSMFVEKEKGRKELVHTAFQMQKQVAQQ